MSQVKRVYKKKVVEKPQEIQPITEQPKQNITEQKPEIQTDLTIKKEKVKKPKSEKQIQLEAKNKNRFQSVMDKARKYLKDNPNSKWTDCVKKGWELEMVNKKK